MKENWEMDPADVSWHLRKGGSGVRKSSRMSRVHIETKIEMTLRHNPTGVEVHGQIERNYTRKELTAARTDLYNSLYNALETDVAKVLRLRGRQ